MSTQEPFFYQSKYKSAFVANMADRLKDMICEDAGVLLKERQLITPERDISLMMYLNDHEYCSITSIAKALDYSHQRVTARISALEALGLITRKTDPKDLRKKCICLSSIGKAESIKITEVYVKAAQVMDEIFKEIKTDLMNSLLTTIQKLRERSLYTRFNSQN